MRLLNESFVCRTAELFIWLACIYFSTSYLFNLWGM
jgi:hypothetical protein